MGFLLVIWRAIVQSFGFDLFFKRLFILIFLGGLVYAIYLMKSVIAPFVVAFVLAYLLNPIVSKLAKQMSRFTAVLVVYALAVVALFLLVGWAVPMLWQQLKIFWNYLPVAVDWYNGTGRIWVEQYTGNQLLEIDDDVIREQVTLYLQSHYQFSDVRSILRRLLTSGMGFANVVGMVFLVPILTFYFLMSWQARLQTWGQAIPISHRPTAFMIAKDCDRALMSFVKGQFTVMILLGLIYAVQLQIIGLEIGFVIGMIAGIASFVPYLGFGVGIVVAMVAGLLQFGLDWVKLVLIFGAFMVGQAVESYVLQPFLLGDKIGLSPLWVIFVVLAGASLFGFVGMLIALPVGAVINVLFLHAYKAYQESEWYKGRRQYRLF